VTDQRAWLSTREVAELLGVSDLKWLRDRLRILRVTARRLGEHARIRWSRTDVERAFHVESCGGKRGEAGS